MNENLTLVNGWTTETKSFVGTRYQRTIGGFIVDGDYVLQRLDKRNNILRTTYSLSDVVMPMELIEPPIPDAVPILIDSNCPSYYWIGKRPDDRTPCWLIEAGYGTGKYLNVINMRTRELIGRTTPLHSYEVVGGLDSTYTPFYTDVWYLLRQECIALIKAAGHSVTEFIDGPKDPILEDLLNHDYWFNIVHGGSRAMALADNMLYSTDVAIKLRNKQPYTLAFINSCGAMDYLGDDLSWPWVFTKNKIGSFAIGETHGGEMTAVQIIPRDMVVVGFFSNLLLGFSIPDAFERAVADNPSVAGFFRIFEGTSPYAQEVNNIVVDIEPAGAGITSLTTGLYDLLKPIGNIQAFPSSNYRFERYDILPIHYSHTIPQQSFVKNPLNIDELYRDFLHWDFDIKLEIKAIFTKIPPTNILLGITGIGTTDPLPGTYQLNKLSDGKALISATAVPAEGYAFLNWTVSDNDLILNFLNPKLVYQTSSDYVTLTATFVEKLEATVVNINVTGPGTTNPLPGTFGTTIGSVVKLEAITTSAAFKHWNIVNSKGIAEQFATPVIYLNVDQEYTATAVFETSNKTLVVLVSPVGAGIVDIGLGTHTYLTGSQVNFNLTPSEGYIFSYWSVLVDGVAQPNYPQPNGEILMLGNITMTAILIPRQQSQSVLVKIGHGDGGYTQPSAGEYSYIIGSTLILHALPYTGYKFYNWLVFVGNKSYNAFDSKLTIIMNTPASITTIAYFRMEIPTTPTYLNAQLLQPSVIQLSWGKSEGVIDSYRVERDSGSGFALVTTTQDLIYRDTQLEIGTTYIYRVLASNNSGSSNYSNEVTIRTGDIAPKIGSISAYRTTDIETYLGAEISDLGTADVVYILFAWGLTIDLGNETSVMQMYSKGSVGIPITLLLPDTTYFYRAVVVGTATIYSEIKTFKTKKQVSLNINYSGFGSVTVVNFATEIRNFVSGKFAQGTVLHLFAEPGSGWQLVSWSGTVQNSDRQITITLSNDTEINISFVPVGITPIANLVFEVYNGYKVNIRAVFYGWLGPIAGIMITRSDLGFADNTGSIYVTGGKLGLSLSTDIGKTVMFVATVNYENGYPYLRVDRDERAVIEG